MSQVESSIVIQYESSVQKQECESQSGVKMKQVMSCDRWCVYRQMGVWLDWCPGPHGMLVSVLVSI
jgi:hypothetical protein